MLRLAVCQGRRAKPALHGRILKAALCGSALRDALNWRTLKALRLGALKAAVARSVTLLNGTLGVGWGGVRLGEHRQALVGRD